MRPASPAPPAQLQRRRRIALIVVTAVVVGLAAVIAGSLLWRTGPEPPNGSGLLPWLPRGGLADDEALIDSAESLWRSGSAVDAATVVVPDGEIYVLWADRIGAGRVVIMEAVGTDGKPYVAQVSEQGDPPALGLDTVDLLPAEQPIALAVTYDGNLEIPGLTPGRGSSLIQLLPGPAEENSDLLGLWRYEPSFADNVLERLDPKPSGMTETFLQVDSSNPAGTPIVIATTVGASAGVSGTIAVHGGRLIPTDAPLALADDADWGPSGRIDGNEYSALVLAALKLELPEATGFVAASVNVDELELGVVASLVVLRQPDGVRRIACVVTDGALRDVVPDAVFVDPAEVDLAQVDALGGSCPVILDASRRLVAVAAARPGAGDVVIETTSGVLGGPAESVAVVLAEGLAPTGLVARLDGFDDPRASYPIPLEAP